MAESRAGQPLLAKVCGLRTEADVLAAAGADMVGFVSYPSSMRHLTDERIVALAAAMVGGPETVLVTVGRPRVEVEHVVAAAGLDAVQLCGDERPRDWRAAPFRVLRRVPVSGAGLAEIEAWRDIASLFVLDSPRGPGGYGETVDAAIAAELAAHAPCLLAGGMGPERLARGLGIPLSEAPLAGVDASSQLESTPGVKDPGLVRRYIEWVHGLSVRREA